VQLRQTTREIIQSVEDLSGFPVQVLDDPKLTTLSAMSMARRGGSLGVVPAHIVRYKPVPGESPDYLICYQCGFILRKFAVPPDQRFDLVDTAAGRGEVRRALLAPDGMARKYGLKDAQVAELQSMFLGGLLTHLLSIPIGLRVGAWLMTTYPELGELQQAVVRRELAAAREALAPQIREGTPAKVYTSSLCISAAFALFWATAYSQPDLQAPYRLKYEKGGTQLLTIWRDLPDDPAHDVELVDRWADALGLGSWYTWAPYEPPG
jgi:hypothetical protein